MKKIVLIPLDERPCNMLFPERLFSKEKFHIVRPDVLGDKKTPADFRSIEGFLKRECRDADGLILSIDMLLYGGLVPSRIHHETNEELFARLQVVREVRKMNPEMLIYAFQVIMRCPNYSSSDEEPDYYEKYGKAIHDAGVAIHKSRLGLEGDSSLSELMLQIDKTALNDYVDRREQNLQMNIRTLELLREGVIDALVIPQDDSASYGYAAMDQQSVREKTEEMDLTDQVLAYPGADEVELTLLARMVNAMSGRHPKVFVKYAAEKARELVPLYEGAALADTLKYHILSAGCQQTESWEQADIILAVTAPAGKMEEAEYQPSRQPGYYRERNIPELIEFIKKCIREGKVVSIADNAYANGGETSFVHLLDKNGLLLKLGGYAGWNTSANTIGTALAEAVDVFYFGYGSQHQDFLIERYLEDCGYCSVVRWQVNRSLPDGMDYFHVEDGKGEVCDVIRKGLMDFAKKILPSIVSGITVTKIELPWRRMFEVDLEAEYRG